MSVQRALIEPPPVTMTMEDLLNTFDWDTYIAEYGNEGFTPLPALGREQLAASPDEVEQLVEWNPGSSPSEDSPRVCLQTTEASFHRGHSQIEQEFSQNVHSGSWPQTISPAPFSYGLQAPAVYDSPFQKTLNFANSVHPFFHSHTESEDQNESSSPLGFNGFSSLYFSFYTGYYSNTKTGNVYHLSYNFGESHYKAVTSNAPVSGNDHSSPNHAVDDDEQLHLSVEESFRRARERHLGEGEWNFDEDGVDGEQSQSPVQWSPASGPQQEHLDRQGPSPNKRRNPDEAVEKRACKLCGAVLSHVSSLKGHYAQHLSNPQSLTPEQILTAEQCCKGKPLHRCSHCPMVSDRQATVDVHERLHQEGSSVTKCSICEVVLTSPYIRKEHMKRHHTDWHNTFMRDGCHRSETTYNEEDDHDFNHSGIDPAGGPVENESRGVYECRLCSARLVSRSFRRVHYAAHRLCAERESEEAGAVKSKKGKVKEQGKCSDVEVPLFQCRQCTAVLKSKYLLDKHCAGHLAEELGDGGDVPNENVAQAVLGRFKCQTCDEAFKTRYFLKKHYRMHLKEKEPAISKQRKLDNPAWGEFKSEEPCNAEPQTYNDRSKHAKTSVGTIGDISAS
ncbi:hypothetical protein DFP73DRAFT_524679 [Morchella snyderi]|nr:hypothetical protein DFP73DRAFT_524679 [Morchella snyderi]